MDFIMKALEFLKGDNFLIMVGAIVMILNGIVGVAMLVPGSEPENFLKKVVAFIERFSKK